MNKKFFIPIAAFMVLVALLVFGLFNAKNREILPSTFIGKPAPQFELPRLYKTAQTISTDEMKGKVWILNIWASWCPSCRGEHAVLTRLINKEKVPTIGLNYKDYGTEEYGNAALQWLASLGNPYYAVAVDKKGSAALDWGIVGAPETFLMDKKGIVRYKFTGPVYQQVVDETLIPLIKKLREEEG